jgi:hypothetical protein
MTDNLPTFFDEIQDGTDKLISGKNPDSTVATEAHFAEAEVVQVSDSVVVVEDLFVKTLDTETVQVSDTLEILTSYGYGGYGNTGYGGINNVSGE